MLDDLISRQAAIDDLKCKDPSQIWDTADVEVWVNALPSAQPETHEERTETHACDCISRQAAMEEISKQQTYKMFEGEDTLYLDANDVGSVLASLPSTQPEPLSDAYTKAVWTWLLDYQVKAAELKGRYTPYEVLSWVANDWRKEHEHNN